MLFLCTFVLSIIAYGPNHVTYFEPKKLFQIYGNESNETNNAACGTECFSAVCILIYFCKLVFLVFYFISCIFFLFISCTVCLIVFTGLGFTKVLSRPFPMLCIQLWLRRCIIWASANHNLTAMISTHSF